MHFLSLTSGYFDDSHCLLPENFKYMFSAYTSHNTYGISPHKVIAMYTCNGAIAVQMIPRKVDGHPSARIEWNSGDQITSPVRIHCMWSSSPLKSLHLALPWLVCEQPSIEDHWYISDAYVRYEADIRATIDRP